MPVLPIILSMGKNDEFKAIRLPSATALQNAGFEVVIVAYEEATTNTQTVRTELLEPEGFSQLWDNEESAVLDALVQLELFDTAMITGVKLKDAVNACLDGSNNWDFAGLEPTGLDETIVVANGKGSKKKGKKKTGKKKPGFTSTASSTTTTGSVHHGRKLGACLP